MSDHNAGCMAFIVLAVLAGLVGWVANIVQLIQAMGDPITGTFILKCVGVFVAPLGSVLGYVGMF